ncbi:MAG: RNA methyltransferase [Myxococcales bacterium]|nr:RNA methyltransferase [Myxococcales bacterium]
MNAPHPRDRCITVYGRKPVLEALLDRRVTIEKLLIAQNAHGEQVEAIRAEAKRRGVRPKTCPPREVTRLSRNGRQDQGVALDVVAPRMRALDAFLADGQAGHLLLLDGLTNPANVGLLLRTAVAAGLAGVVLPRAGCPEVGPLVIKASAGVAFRAPILRAPSAVEAADALRAAGFALIGLRGHEAVDLYGFTPPAKAVFVLGNETAGVSEAVSARLDAFVSIPMCAEVESLNVAVAGAVVAFELLRRQRAEGQSNSAQIGA